MHQTEIMSEKPLVSTIIPFYNTPDEFLQEAIESVFAQKYQNWEILLVDDGSHGECSDIARNYEERYPAKVRYLAHHNHQNRGLSASRNLGIGHSNGKYIAFLDADDVWLPEKLEQQVSILASRPRAGMVYGKSQYWWSWTGHPEHESRDRVQGHNIEGDCLFDPPTLLTLYLKGRASIPCTCSILLRKEIIEQVGGFEEDFHGLYEDQAFYAKICLETPIFLSNECWDRYRQHADSLCASATGEELRSAHLNYLEWLEDYLLEKNLRDSGLWRALQKEKWLRRHRGIGSILKRAQRFVWRLQGNYQRRSPIQQKIYAFSSRKPSNK